MSNKQNLNDITLNTIENIADEVLFKSATTLLEDITKSVPVASIVLGLTKAYTNYKNAREQKQLLAFIQESQNTDPDFIERFFKDKTNSELGFEILGVLDQTYLEKQARMIYRSTKLFKDKEISKQEFDKYIYIITKLNNHLISLFESYYQSGKDIKANPIALPDGKFVNAVATTSCFSNPNMDFISFGFMQEEPQQAYIGAELLPTTQYIRTPQFFEFYSKIFKD